MVEMQARSESGETAFLKFGGDAVRVRLVSQVRQRALRLVCGLVFVTFGTGAVAVNVDTQGHDAVWFWVAAGVLGVGSLGALAWWLIEKRRDARRPVEAITAADVTEGRSVLTEGEVTVSLTMTGGEERSFSAVGHHGAMLAKEFGKLLAVTA